METAEIDVELIKHHDNAMLVTDGDNEVWIPYRLLGEDSEIDRDSEEGDTGVIVIPEWEAVEIGLV